MFSVRGGDRRQQRLWVNLRSAFQQERIIPKRPLWLITASSPLPQRIVQLDTYGDPMWEPQVEWQDALEVRQLLLSELDA